MDIWRKESIRFILHITQNKRHVDEYRVSAVRPTYTLPRPPFRLEAIFTQQPNPRAPFKPKVFSVVLQICMCGVQRIGTFLREPRKPPLHALVND